MTLVSIGAVTTELRDPSLRWTGGPTAKGFRSCSISGLLNWSEALQLSEIVANPELQETIGGVTGVRENLVFSGTRLSSFSGWYLIESFELGSVEPKWTIHTSGYQPVPFSLDAHFIGTAA